MIQTRNGKKHKNTYYNREEENDGGEHEEEAEGHTTAEEDEEGIFSLALIASKSFFYFGARPRASHILAESRSIANDLLQQ